MLRKKADYQLGHILPKYYVRLNTDVEGRVENPQPSHNKLYVSKIQILLTCGHTHK